MNYFVLLLIRVLRKGARVERALREHLKSKGPGIYKGFRVEEREQVYITPKPFFRKRHLALILTKK